MAFAKLKKDTSCTARLIFFNSYLTCIEIGTPLQNNLKELWAMIFYLAPDIFTSSKPFEDGFDLLRGIIDAGILRRARKLLSVFMLRRVKDQVDVQLPNRRELTLLVPLTDMQKRLYKQLLCGLGQEVIEMVMTSEVAGPSDAAGNVDSTDLNGKVTAASSRTDLSAIAADPEPEPASSGGGNGGPNDSEWRMLMNLLLQLRKVCNHTYLMPDIAPDPYEITGTINSSLSGSILFI